MNASVEQRLAHWLVTERREEESIEAATSRFRTYELGVSRRALRIRSEGAPVPFVPLVDDGITDERWLRKNPGRQYRVRPWRSIDGQPTTYHSPCFSVFDVVTKRGPRGIPIEALHDVGFPAQPEDSDQFGLLVMHVFAASKGFRNKRPGFAS